MSRSGARHAVARRLRDLALREEVQRAAEWLQSELIRIGLPRTEIFPTDDHPMVYGEWLDAGPTAPSNGIAAVCAFMSFIALLFMPFTHINIWTIQFLSFHLNVI